jgi:hypothetical protein
VLRKNDACLCFDVMGLPRSDIHGAARPESASPGPDAGRGAEARTAAASVTVVAIPQAGALCAAKTLHWRNSSRRAIGEAKGKRNSRRDHAATKRVTVNTVAISQLNARSSTRITINMR